MMMRRLSVVLCALCLSACSVRHGNFTVLSNKLISTKFGIEELSRRRNVVGKNTEHMIILFPTGTPKLEEALNDALNKTDTDLMTDVSVESWFWYIPYVYGNAGWEVKGDAVKTRKN